MPETRSTGSGKPDLDRSLPAYLLAGGRAHARSLLVYSVLVNLMILAPSLHMMQVYDRVLSSGSGETLFSITVIALFAIAVYGLAEMVRLRIAARLSAHYAVNVSSKLFASLGRADSPGNATDYIRDFGLARQFLASRVFVGLFDLPFVPFFLVLLFFVHPTICLLAALGLATMVLAGYVNIAFTDAGRTVSRRSEAEAAGFAQSVLTRTGEVRAMGMLPHLLPAWNERTAAALRAAEDASPRATFLQALTRAVRQAIQIGTMAWGAWLVLDGDMSGGMIFLASMISGKALAPVEQAIGGWETIARSFDAFGAVEGLIGPDKTLKTLPDLPEPIGHLQARDLVFKGAGRRPALAGLAIDVRPGEAMLVLGAPGAGKSVLLAVLAGSLTPDDGVVYLDGTPRERWPIAQWGRSIGYCSQFPGILSGTVAQNIARFAPNPAMDEIYRVAKLLDAYEDIMELPNGFQTPVSETSPLLNGSLRQKIALARAFYGDPATLVLDSPSLGLDAAGEGALANAIADIKKAGRSVVLATQSPMLMRIADRAVTLRAGMAIPVEPPSRSRSGFQRGPQRTEVSA